MLKNKKKYKKYLLIILVILNTSIAKSQTSYKDEHVFFKSKRIEFQTWLDNTNLSSVITVDTLLIEDSKLTILLLLDNGAWSTLNAKYDTLYAKKFGNYLFEKVHFLFEVPAEDISITIQDFDPSTKEINISYRNKLIDIEPSINRGTEIIPIKLAKVVGLQKENFSASTENFKLKLKRHFENYYATKGIAFGKAICNVNIEEEAIITIEVYNISREILYDCGISCYFESIKIIIEIGKNNENLQLNYTLLGKYGSGIFIAPRKSDYKDIELVYKSYLEEYQQKIKDDIHKILTNR